MSTQIAVGTVAVTLALGSLLLGAAARVVDHHEAAGVADSAALAAADAHFGWIPGEPCQVAELVASGTGRKVAFCEINNTNVLIGVKRNYFSGVVKARAGV